MDFFNKAIDSLSTAGKELGKQADNVSEVAKLSFKMQKNEKSLQENYRKLGELIYENYPDKASQLYPEITRIIGKIKLEVECDKRELAACKGKKICPKCGAQQLKSNAYCNECGMDISWAAKAFKAEKRVDLVKDTRCKNCGRSMSAGTVYCNSCGAKII